MRIDKELAFVALAISPVLFSVSRISKRKLRVGWRTVRKLENTSYSVVQEVLGTVRVVKAFGREDHEQNRYVVHGQAGLKARLRMTLTEGLFTLAVGMTTASGMAAVLWIGVGTFNPGH